MRRWRNSAGAAAAAITLFLAGTPAYAQVGGIGPAVSGGGPLEIESDQGLELHQNQQMVVARGNVVVRQGETVLQADVVSASYRETDGKRTITRVDAVGNVRIAAGKEKISGGNATYVIDQQLFLLTGKSLRIVSTEQTVTAESTLEYWGLEKRAVARGNASAIRTTDNTRLTADVIEALLEAKPGKGLSTQVAADRPADEKLTLSVLNAWGGVTVSTPSEIVQGDKAQYDAVRRVAILEGEVKITRGKNQLNGERAIVDLENGVSRLVGSRGKRERSIFYPGQSQSAPSQATKAESAARDLDKQAPDESVKASFVLPRPRPDQAP